MERDTPLPKSVVYLFMYVSDFPQKGRPLQHGEKHKVTAHRDPRRRKAYIQLGCGLVPQWYSCITATITVLCIRHRWCRISLVSLLCVTKTCVRDTVSAGRRKLWNWCWGRKCDSIMYKDTDTNQIH